MRIRDDIDGIISGLKGTVREGMDGIMKQRVLIGIPCNYDFIHTRFMHSYITLEKPYQTVPCFSGTSRIDKSRDSIVQNAIQRGMDYIFFLDSDMCPSPFCLTNLMKYNLDVVGAICFRKIAPYTPCIAKDVDGKMKAILDYEKGLIEVDYIGAGCLLIKTKIFEKIQPPWFRFTEMSEDYTFCKLARDNGFKIYCDTNEICPHLIQGQISENQYTQFQKTQEYGKILETLKQNNELSDKIQLSKLEV